ncbi:unnamed protein product [Albugo candida]|uniref:C3H1-type domain-containing protein n=1 Tax=Albugo candida TaxID=65357 RepID=A0A024GL50_9STRA|nr:unnamed protein product [Albugo candida]|eukprot:CCI47260.1 unnamed protein product [Albugo candida]
MSVIANTLPLSVDANLPPEIGQPVHINTQKHIQRQINGIIGWNDTSIAPMTIPQTLLRSNLSHVGEQSYFVCEKSVGCRYLVLLLQGRCYLISPNYEMRELILFCPVRPDRLQPGVDRHVIVPHQWTLLDGLLVSDKDGTKTALSFLAYDIILLNGTPVMSSKLQDRLKLLQNDVVGPRKSIPLPKGQPPDPFQLVVPSMYPVSRIEHVIRSIIPRVSQTRQNAGLSFTPVSSPYKPGQTNNLFHWTPAPLVTVDFQLGVEWRGRPPTTGYKLMSHEKRTPVFYDWITFSKEQNDHFRQDKKASTRIIQCVYDAEWLTFVPSSENKSWDVGDPEFNDTAQGQGWRKGGWRFVRTASDRNAPWEKSLVSLVEQAFSENIQMEELGLVFSEEKRKSGLSAAKVRVGDSGPMQEHKDLTTNKKQRSGAGVCYDFQNKGVCQRGRFCHFSHCACNSTCLCTPANNTYGQRPAYRKNDFDAPPSPENTTTNSSTRSENCASTYPDDEGAQSDEASLGDEEPVESIGQDVVSNEAFVLLEPFDKDALAAKRAQISMLVKHRIWSNLGLKEKTSTHSRLGGLLIHANGTIEWVQPEK